MKQAQMHTPARGATEGDLLAPEGPEAISALADGALAGDAFAATLQALHQRPEALSQWCMAHLIGDALRAPDLCRSTRPPQDFAASVMARIAQEAPARPVVAPPVAAEAPVVTVRRAPAANQDVFRWKLAAGFASLAAVAAIGWQNLSALRADEGGALALARPAVQSAPAARAGAGDSLSAYAALSPAAEGMALASLPADGGNPAPRMLRNARLDEFLAAHHGALGVATLQAPGVVRASVEGVAR